MTAAWVHWSLSTEFERSDNQAQRAYNEPIMSILGSSRVSESRNSHDLKGAKLEAILDVGLAIELDLISNYNSTSLFKIKSWIRFKNRNPYWHSPTKKLLKFCDLIVAMPLHRCISAIYIG